MSIPAHKIFADSLNQVDFDRSLPARYRAAFYSEDRQRHAQICARRRGGPVSVGLCTSRKPGQSLVCVSAEDAPGVLAAVSASFATLGFEIQEAVAFTRTPRGGTSEILDLFWLRDPSQIISEEDVHALENLLTEYLAERPSQTQRPGGPFRSAPSGVQVRFRDERSGTLSVLEVETGDRFGLLWEISNLLTSAGVQIVASEIRTRGGRVMDSFTIEEISGESISVSRRLEIQTSVLGTLEM